MSRSFKSTCLALLICISYGVIESSASAAESLRTTFLFSRSLSGGVPNGPSRNPAVSHDQRIARVIAYESDASDIVAGDLNAVTDVFMVTRAPGWGKNGTPWVIGQTTLVSRGLGGEPANGRSFLPAIDGSSHAKPRCIGFISEASNLVRGDTNGVADAFVYYIPTGSIERVSVNSKGQQSNGPSSEIAVDGDCARVAFVSSATNLNLRKDIRLAWSTAVTGRPSGQRQVYVRIRKEKGHDRAFNGLTFLASVNDRGTAANGASYEVTLSRSGKAVAFASDATNLDPADKNGVTDIYRRSFTREFKHIKKKGVQVLKFNTRLVSATRSGRPGDGPSSFPSITDDGRYVAFQTDATTLLPGDSNAVTDIARADLKGKRTKQDWVSKSYVGIGNGPSIRPVISDAGEFVLFDSLSTIFKPSESVAFDQNGVSDLFLWNAPTRNTSLESRDWNNKYLKTPSWGAATSSRGNYVMFESADANIDQLIVNNSGIPQVYMRYLGPK